MERADLACNFSFIKALPCPSYVLLSDANLTICATNTAFLHLIGCDEKELRYQYGSKLSAIMDVEPFHHFLLSGIKKSSFRHKAILKEGDKSFYTQLARNPDHNGEYIVCISFNVTDYAKHLRALRSYKNAAVLAFQTAGFGLFEWNTATEHVKILNSCPLFNTLPDEPSIQELKMFLNIKTSMESSQIDFLLNRSIAEEPRLDCEFTWNNEASEPKWCRLEIIKQETNSIKILVGVLEDITDKKTIFLNHLKEMQFYHLLLSEKTAYGQIDITEDRIIMIGGLWNLYNELIHQNSYSQIVVEFINKVVHPDDRTHYLEVMDRENLIQSFSRGISSLGCEFRRLVEQNKMSWMKLSIRLFAEPYSGHLMGQIYIENIAGPQKALPSDITNSTPAPAEYITSGGLKNDFDTLVGKQGDMAYLVDPDTFELLCGNEAFFSRIGMTAEECSSVKCYEVMHQRVSPCPFCGKVNWSADKFFLWKDLNPVLEQELLIKNRLVNWKGRQVLLALAVDISNDKSVIDSISSTDSESHIILSSVEHMNSCPTLEASIKSVLDSIVFFFQADMAALWVPLDKNKSYSLICKWAQNKSPIPLDKKAITAFCCSGKWDDYVALDCPEAAIAYSSEMYRTMEKNNFFNQRWKMLEKGKPECGVIIITNCKANLQNISFIASLSNFILSDIEKWKLLDFIFYSSNHDRLTGLLNRIHYEMYLQSFNPDQVSSLGVILANMDNLNEINMKRGELVGNQYIKQFAGILLELFGTDDAYRINGDEFLVIAVNISRTRLEALMYKLSAKINGQTNYSVSFGYTWDDIEKNLKEMIISAQEAMKFNKKKHSTTNIIPSNLESGKMLKSLMQDIKNQQYKIYLQPKFNMEAGVLIGAEALIRLVDERQNIIPPVEFIPSLEANHLIRYIDLFVLKEVCMLLQKWKSQNRSTITVSLNFSPLTLCEDDILSNITHVLDEFDIEKENIEIEITESILAEDRGVIIRTARELSQSGYNLSLDDFGVRYANLSMLADIQFHTVKLDKSLIKTLEYCENNQIILKNIIHLCKDLKINVIAEGVETKEQMNILNTLKCSFGQGYLFGKPMPVEEFETYFLRRS